MRLRVSLWKVVRMSTPLRVLFVEDSVEEPALLVRQLRRGGYDPTFARVDSADALGAALGAQTWDIIIAEYTMSRFSTPAALNQLKERGLDLPFIIVSADIGEDHAASAIKAGAYEYINRENLTRLIPAVERAVREAEVRRAQVQAEERLAWLASFPERNPHPVLEANPDGKITYLNPSAVKMFPDITSAGLAHPILEDLDVLAAQFRRGGQSFIEREVTSADVVYHQTLSYVPGHDLIQMYLVDVTERKHAEEEREPGHAGRHA